MEPDVSHQHPTPAAGPTGKWYFVITILSAGLLAAVPFFHAASRLGRPDLRRIGAGMAGAALVGFAIFAAAPENRRGEATGWLSDVGGFLLVAVMLVACLMLIGIRREVYPGPGGPAPVSRNEGAMKGVQEARQRREEARRIAASDPMAARDLGIGRVGFQRAFDDGGLVELNYADAQQIASACQLPPAVAESVVAARSSLGRFQVVEDAISLGQVDEYHAVLVRDRGVVIRDW